MRTLLSLGIAILYPVVVYFAVMTMVPRVKEAVYPSYPNCSRYNYNYSSSSYQYNNPSCDQDFRKYDEAVQNYQNEREKDEEKDTTRAQLALAIAVLTIIGALFLRDVRELMAGLSVGGMVVIIVASTVVLGTSYDEDLATGNVMLVLLTFLTLTTILYMTEKSLPVFKTSENASTPPKLKD